MNQELKAESALQEKRYRLHRDHASRLKCLFTRPFGHVGEKYQVEVAPGVWSQLRCKICGTTTATIFWWWRDPLAEN